MNEEPTPVNEPKKRTRKARKPSGPRTINPAIAALRAEHAAKVEEHRKHLDSSKVLIRIETDLLPRLITSDLQALFDKLDTLLHAKPA